ncbi:MAG: flagellar basal body L-ring protein FlgH [Firmicutes bacterium]|nr:flagellar basal body L-ring protein FlgH [Bacillota bacterium]
MRKLIRWLGIVTISLLLVSQFSVSVLAISLFETNGKSMFSDQKARQVGDLVTVLIVEKAQATQSVGSSTDSGSSFNIGPGTGVLADFIPLIGFGGGDEFSAKGSVARQGSITAKMTTKVVEVYPNGNLKIEGRQKIQVNGEEQEIVISGIIRSKDIGPDNTIVSSLVADAEIDFVGTGVIAEKQQPGIITRILNWLF